MMVDDIKPGMRVCLAYERCPELPKGSLGTVHTTGNRGTFVNVVWDKDGQIDAVRHTNADYTENNWLVPG
jgi:hypothetical protein